jgi:GTPase SAR1 family protein
VVTGDASVGKTNIITRFTTNEFDSNHKATIGVEFGHVEMVLKNDKKVSVQIWDTGANFTNSLILLAGQERFRAIARG